MTSFGKTLRLAVLLSALVIPELAAAANLTGAWTSDAGNCKQVFKRRGRAMTIGFTQSSDRHGGGFVIDGDQLRGKFVTCRIKTRREDGDNVNLIAACATDVMLSNVQMVLKVVDDDTIKRLFPGIDGMEIEYHRCRI